VRQTLVILLLALPIVIQVCLNAGIAYVLNRALGVAHNIACPSALIGASHFFELAVAAAIVLFGFQSGAALATVVGALVEVPVMLSVVAVVLKSRRWYECARLEGRTLLRLSSLLQRGEEALPCRRRLTNRPRG
jgi:ACR3 family arsenite transporter